MSIFNHRPQVYWSPTERFYSRAANIFDEIDALKQQIKLLVKEEATCRNRRPITLKLRTARTQLKALEAKSKR